MNKRVRHKYMITIAALLSFTVISCTIIGCSQYKAKDNPVKEQEVLVSLEDSIEENTLKDWPFPGANGNFVPSRDALEESDTVVDGYPYNRI